MRFSYVCGGDSPEVFCNVQVCDIVPREPNNEKLFIFSSVFNVCIVDIRLY